MRRHREDAIALPLYFVLVGLLRPRSAVVFQRCEAGV